MVIITMKHNHCREHVHYRDLDHVDDVVDRAQYHDNVHGHGHGPDPEHGRVYGVVSAIEM